MESESQQRNCCAERYDDMILWRINKTDLFELRNGDDYCKYSRINLRFLIIYSFKCSTRAFSRAAGVKSLARLDISNVLATATVAQQSVFKNPFVFCFKMTINDIDYIWYICCFPVEN